MDEVTHLFGTGITDFVTDGFLVTLAQARLSDRSPTHPLVLLLKDLSPDVIERVLDYGSIVGVVSAGGSLTSHAAVLLRELTSHQQRAIAGVVGIDAAAANPLLGRRVTVDGLRGIVSAGTITANIIVPEARVPSPIARQEKRKPRHILRNGLEWTCPKPSYKFSVMEQSLIAPGYRHSPVTLYGEVPGEVSFDAAGRIWIHGYQSGRDIANRIIEEPAWFRDLADRQYYRFSKTLRRFLEGRSTWLRLRDDASPKELADAWRYIVDASYHLYRFLPLTSSSYPHLFQIFVEEVLHLGIQRTAALAMLRTLGRSAAAAQALQYQIFPLLDKDVLAFTALSEPYPTVPLAQAPSDRKLTHSLSSESMSSELPQPLTEMVSLMFEVKDEKFYLAATIQSWTAYLLTCTQAQLIQQGMASECSLSQLTKYTVEDIIERLNN